MSDIAGLRPAGKRNRLIDVRQCKLTMLGEDAPGIGQFDTPRGACKQSGAHGFFERLDDAAQCGLRHVHPVGGDIELERIRDREKGSDVMNVDAHIPSCLR